MSAWPNAEAVGVSHTDETYLSSARNAYGDASYIQSFMLFWKGQTDSVQVPIRYKVGK